MNKYTLLCDKLKNGFQVGSEGSIADFKNKLENHCFPCFNFITCKNSQEYLRGIINQQNNILACQS